MLLKNESPKEFSTEDNKLSNFEKNTENDKLISSEIEEEKIIDQEISNEIGDSDEAEEAQIIKSDYKYLLNGIAMPKKIKLEREKVF